MRIGHHLTHARALGMSLLILSAMACATDAVEAPLTERAAVLASRHSNTAPLVTPRPAPVPSAAANPTGAFRTWRRCSTR